MTVSDGIRRASLNAISAENAAVVINVIDLRVTLGTADAILSCILGGFDIDAIRRAIRRTQEAGNAFLKPVLIALAHINAAKALLEFGAPERPRPIGIVLDNRRLEHLPEGDAHALGDGGDVLKEWHTTPV